MKKFTLFIIFQLVLSMHYLNAQVTTKTYLGQPVDFRVYRGVKIVGYDNPIKSRAVLEAVEKDLILESYPAFPSTLFLPNTSQKAQQIQQIRQANWPLVDGKKVRDQELLVTKTVLNEIPQAFPDMTINALDYWILNYDIMKGIWATGIPAINRTPRLKRIVVLDEKVASTNNSRSFNNGGWQVNNTTDFSFWANDELIGNDEISVRGDIPYDIDSRWTITKGWLDALRNGGLGHVLFNADNHCSIDYGVLHELSHHLPVGDHYVYTPGAGVVFLPNAAFNKTIRYLTVVDFYFLANELMANAHGTKLSALTSYSVNLWQKLNPLNERNPQKFDVAGPVNDIIGTYYYDQVQIKLENLQGFGLQNVFLMKENGSDLSVSTNYTSQSFTGSTYTVVFSKQQQNNLFPSFHIALQKDGVVLPLMIPRLVLEAAAFKAVLNGQSLSTPLEIKIDMKSYTANVLTKLKDLFAQPDLNTGGTAFKMYAYNTSQESPADIFAELTLDNLGNRYAMAFEGADHTVAGISGPACVQSGQPTTFTVNLDYGNFVSINWWVNGDATIRQDPTDPKKAIITMSQYNTAPVTVNVGISYPTAPWNQTYQKQVVVNNCSSLRTSNGTGLIAESMNVKVFDYNGRELLTGESTDPQTFFNHQLLPDGLYFMQITNSEGSFVRKVMK
jgi:hypothetical protein